MKLHIAVVILGADALVRHEQTICRRPGVAVSLRF
jgi:hypothetical protein